MSGEAPAGGLSEDVKVYEVDREGDEDSPCGDRLPTVLGGLALVEPPPEADR